MPEVVVEVGRCVIPMAKELHATEFPAAKVALQRQSAHRVRVALDFVDHL
jgi:hypothetical protein